MIREAEPKDRDAIQHYRRQGIGRRLTEHLIQVCRARKCTRIILLSNDHRKEAHAVYESMVKKPCACSVRNSPFLVFPLFRYRNRGEKGPVKM
jgi:GNAT superfamily N-acetyltransferase